MSGIKVGDLVVPKDTFFLWNRYHWYNRAICVSTSPFVLVSDDYNMLWSSDIKESDFTSVGPAHPDKVKKCKERAIREGAISEEELREKVDDLCSQTYIPEIWSVKKDVIYSAIENLKKAIGYTESYLRNATDNKVYNPYFEMVANGMQKDIDEMKSCLEELKKLKPDEENTNLKEAFKNCVVKASDRIMLHASYRRGNSLNQYSIEDILKEEFGHYAK